MAKQDSSISPRITPSSFEFLADLKKNNNREWFAVHKETFQKEQQQVEILAEALLQALNTHDVIETASGKKSLHRIYRDTRFSPDKTPYKTNWSGGFKRAGKHRRGGLYFHLEPGNSFVGGGFWAPSPADLKLIREDIAFDAVPLRTILDSESFISTFGTLEGEQVKTAPKGYPADHEAIDLLRYKQFLVRRRFSDEEVFSDGFVDLMNDGFKNMRPFLDYMSEVLSTDVNGLKM